MVRWWIVAAVVLAAGGGVVGWVVTRPGELEAARAEAERTCPSVVDGVPPWFGVPAPDDGGPCARAVSTVAHRLGFTSSDVNRALAVTDGSTARMEHGRWVMAVEGTATGSLVWFRDMS